MRRIDGAQDEGAEEVETLEALSDDVPRQRLEVDDDVGELWHEGAYDQRATFCSHATICSRVQ